MLIVSIERPKQALLQYEERSDYNDVNCSLEVIADEEHHMKLL